MQLDNLNILITGGASGIGKYLASELAVKARRVIIIDNNNESLMAIKQSEKVVCFLCDLTDAEQVTSTIKSIYNDYGGVDVCINNAGIIHSEPLINLLARPDRKHNISNWKRVIDINLNAIFYVTSNIVDCMVDEKRKGLIINISSIAAQGNIGQSAYSASKAAVEALTKTWSKELSMFGIRTACIAPGFFNTPSTNASVNPHMLKKWEKAIPLGRLGILDELLSSVEFIINNDYYNGKILSLDGGLNI